MTPDRKPTGWFACLALLTRLGQCALLAAALSCSGCAWFKTSESADTNFREDPKEIRVRPKREDGNHNYGGWSSEAQAIERNLGL